MWGLARIPAPWGEAGPSFSCGPLGNGQGWASRREQKGRVTHSVIYQGLRKRHERRFYQLGLKGTPGRDERGRIISGTCWTPEVKFTGIETRSCSQALNTPVPKASLGGTRSEAVPVKTPGVHPIQGPMSGKSSCCCEVDPTSSSAPTDARGSRAVAPARAECARGSRGPAPTARPWAVCARV